MVALRVPLDTIVHPTRLLLRRIRLPPLLPLLLRLSPPLGIIAPPALPAGRALG